MFFGDDDFVVVSFLNEFDNLIFGSLVEIFGNWSWVNISVLFLKVIEKVCIIEVFDLKFYF